MSLTRETLVTHLVWNCASGEVALRSITRVSAAGEEPFVLDRENPDRAIGPLDSLEGLPEGVASAVSALRSPDSIYDACKASLVASKNVEAALEADAQKALEAGAKRLEALETQKAQIAQAALALKQAQEELEAEQLVLSQRSERITAERQELSTMKTQIRRERPELVDMVNALEAKGLKGKAKDLAKGKQ